LRKGWNFGGHLKCVVSRISMKAPNALDNSYRINPRTRFVEIEKVNHRKSTTNAENYVEIQMRKNHAERERNSSMIMVTAKEASLVC